MRRVAPALVAAAALVAVPAGALLAAQATVEAGGSFSDAPVLASGTYRDTIRGGESLFYAADLASGQSLAVTATIATDDSGSTASEFELELAAPTRKTSSEYRDFTVFDNRDPGEASVSSPVVETEMARDAFRRPGTYYVLLRLDARAQGQYDVTLDLRIEGEPAAGPAQEITPRPTATQASPAASAEATASAPAVSPSPAGAPGSPSGDGRLVALLAGVVGGLVVGGAAGAVTGRDPDASP